MNGERHWWWHRPFLYIGRMVEDKGVPYILQAWHTLKSRYPNVCPPLWLAGGSPEEIDVIRACSGITESITTHESEGTLQWWGYLNPAGLSTLLMRACVLLAHSRYEPGGRVIIESMAQGVPVIATPNGFAADLIIDWENGFLVSFGDLETLICRMEHFIHQPLLRNSLGAEAKRTVTTALTQWDFINTHCDVYDQIHCNHPTQSNLPKMSPMEDSRSYHKRRRIIPTYPHVEQEPSIDDVTQFFQKYTGFPVDSLCNVVTGPGSSCRWKVTSGKEQWIVKWPYARLTLRGLWDSLSDNAKITSSKERFDREVFSASLPCFCPWDANDGKQLLLRKKFETLPTTLDPGLFSVVYNAYRELGQHPLPVFSWASELERNWNAASLEEVINFLKKVRQSLVHTPWAKDRPLSVRLGWKIALLALEQSQNSLLQQFAKQHQNDINVFLQLAEAEYGRTLQVCHGSGDITHCLRTVDGSLLFIDGEHVHPALPGEDIAATIYCAIEDAKQLEQEAKLWPTLLSAITNDLQEKRVILSWAGLLAFESFIKQTTLRTHKQKQSFGRWKVLTQVASNFTL